MSELCYGELSAYIRFHAEAESCQNRISTYNAPATKGERERIEKLTKVKAKYSRVKYSRKEFVRQMTFKAQPVINL